MLKGDDETQLMINQNYRKNYTIEEISNFTECCSFIYSYTEEYHNQISFDNWLVERINHHVKYIDPNMLNINAKSMGVSLSRFGSKELEKVYELTVKNTSPINKTHQWILLDMFASFIILMFSTIGLVYTSYNNYSINFLVVGSLFIGFDLLMNTYQSISQELLITEFYK